MKKISFFIITILILFINLNWYGDYSSSINQVDSSIRNLELNISQYESEKQSMISKYNQLIETTKKEKETKKMQSSWSMNQIWAWSSSASTAQYNQIESYYNSLIKELEDEKTYNTNVYNNAINSLKQNIEENKILKQKYSKMAEVEIIYENAMKYFQNKNFDSAIAEAQRWLNMSQNYGLDSFVDMFKKQINTINENKNEFQNLQNSKNILNESRGYYATALEQYKLWNYDLARQHVSRAINLLENSNIEWKNDLTKLQLDLLSTIDQAKNQQIQADKTKQESDKKQRQLENENNLKKKTEVVFNNIKDKIKGYNYDTKQKTYKSLLIQLDMYKNKLSWDKLIILNHLVYLINSELSKSEQTDLSELFEDLFK